MCCMCHRYPTLRVHWQQTYASIQPSSLVCLEHLVSLFRTTVNARVAFFSHARVPNVRVALFSKFSVTPASASQSTASLRVRGSAAVACTVNLGRASETPPPLASARSWGRAGTSIHPDGRAAATLNVRGSNPSNARGDTHRTLGARTTQWDAVGGVAPTPPAFRRPN